MRSVAELKGAGEPESFLVIDPGKRCGVLMWDQGVYTKWTCSLDELPAELADIKNMGLDFVAIEDYSLKGGVRNNDPSMPSSVGIGMARMACHTADIPLYKIQRNAKRAGHQALDAGGIECWRSARNDHERDVCDMAGLVLRECRLKGHKK